MTYLSDFRLAFVFRRSMIAKSNFPIFLRLSWDYLLLIMAVLSEKLAKMPTGFSMISIIHIEISAHWKASSREHAIVRLVRVAITS